MKDARYWIERMDMIPHPEGGWYHSSYTSSETMFRHDIAGVSSSERKLWSSIYLLLEDEDFTAFHRVRSEEVWYYHFGAPIKIYMISPDGELTTKILGLDIANGQQPQVCVPKNYALGAERLDTAYSLAGVMVSPGFDFDDIKIYDREELISMHPHHKDLIERLTVESFY